MFGDSPLPAATMRVLVLGAYGLIGAGVSRHLRGYGYAVTGLGRNASTARRVLPELNWIVRDMAAMRSPDEWLSVIDGFDAVVNCAGALQDGPRDALQAIHVNAVTALARACSERNVLLVQISAAGVSPEASTPFMRTKAQGDAAIRAIGGDYTILRPGLVIAPSAYGGTALLRMLAAFPLVQPIAHPDAPVRTISLYDLATAVKMAIRGDLGSQQTIDLVEDKSRSLGAVVAAMRQWLGFAPARAQIVMPPWVTRFVSFCADGLGRLGWRSPLRHTAMEVMQDGVDGDPSCWRNLTSRIISPFEATLAATSARTEDRIAARLALLLPFMVGALFFLWAMSGVVGFWQAEAASGVLTAGGWPDGLAKGAVLLLSAVDLLLAALLLVRRFAALACLLMGAVGAVYLVAASVVTPWLWTDPLGSLVKIVPAVVLALACHALLQER